MLEQFDQHPLLGNFVPTVNGRKQSANGQSSLTVRVLLMMATQLDCQSLAIMFSCRRSIEVADCTVDIDQGLARCRALTPQVLVVDPRLSPEAIERSAALVRDSYVGHVIVLDDRVHEGRLAGLLRLPAVSYLTRQAGLDALHAATVKVATRGDRVFDPAIDQRILRTPRGLRLQRLPDRPSISALTARELEVMQHLAQGSSVRDCAELMHLSASTIDNHKSRLMKKLRIHKAAELTHVAIREGLIIV